MAVLNDGTLGIAVKHPKIWLQFDLLTCIKRSAVQVWQIELAKLSVVNPL